METAEQSTQTGTEEIKNDTPPSDREVLIQMAEDSFQDAFNIEQTEEPKAETLPDNPTDKVETTSETKEEKVEEKKEPDNPTGADFDLTLLDRTIKRHDEEISIKEFLKQYPEEAQEIIRKGYDYTKSKMEIKEELRSEKEKLQAKEAGLNEILLANIAYEVEMPRKTKEDFSNDLRYESEEEAEEAFKEYDEQWKAKSQVYAQNRSYADMQNAKMLQEFSEQFKDVKVDDLYKEIQPYLNASVSKGQTPFPKDTLKVYYTGKNHERLLNEAVTKARADEREKVFKEIEGKTKPNITQTTSVQDSKKYIDKSNISEMERSFDEAFDV